MDINYDGDLSKTRTCFRKNTYVFLENYVRVFGKTRPGKKLSSKIYSKLPIFSCSLHGDTPSSC